ncbi:hypothetical protein, conserved [Eimeria brunetti]|uniref:Uncharacterized protein n=1 Tax=Eimeria brunetti TaxID=51314 RepID=U6LQI3_9EIME|nr:hypothetical protein, conserved [Eimeria brunetti]
MHFSSLGKPPRGPTDGLLGSAAGSKGTDGGAEGQKGGPQSSGGGSPGAPRKPEEQGETVSAARLNPHYGEDVDDKIVGTGCSEEYAKLQDCLDDTDNFISRESPLNHLSSERTGESAKNNCVCFSSAVSAIPSPVPKFLPLNAKLCSKCPQLRLSKEMTLHSVVSYTLISDKRETATRTVLPAKILGNKAYSGCGRFSCCGWCCCRNGS